MVVALTGYCVRLIRLALSPEIKVPPVAQIKKGVPGSAKAQSHHGHKKNNAGVAVGATFGVVIALVLVGFLGAKLLKGIKFLGGRKYHDLDGNRPVGTAEPARSPAPMAVNKPRETEMTSV